MKKQKTHHKPDQAPLPKLILQPIQEFFKAEAAGGIVLMVAAFTAILFANSTFSTWFFGLWTTPVVFQFGTLLLDKPLLLWINDGLMAVFFFYVGLEIKRELMVGELSDMKQAAFPIFAALGGMVFPASLYLLFNLGTPFSGGWGIPMATDIAFALGILMLLGKRVPVQLKVFLTALAIVDDLGAVLVIALFYTSNVISGYLWGAALIIGLLLIFNRFGIRKPMLYLIPGVVLWYFVLKSGVHATVAGVLLAMLIPSKAKINANQFVTLVTHYKNKFVRHDKPDELVIANQEQTEALQAIEQLCHKAEAPMLRLEHALSPWVVWFIMPVFAMANAGVELGEGLLGRVGGSVSLGIISGLVIGKPVGIMLFTWVAVRLRWAVVPDGVNWRQVLGAAFLAGIGFTMSMFIAALAFETSTLNEAKTGIIAASLIAAILGSWLLLSGKKQNG